MPFEFNAPRQDKFAKAKYRVTNWAENNEALRQRRDVVSGWCATRSGKRGGQQRYSDLAIKSCLTTEHVVDRGALTDLLGNLAGPVGRFIGGRACERIA